MSDPRRSFWPLWLLLVLAAAAGGIYGLGWLHTPPPPSLPAAELGIVCIGYVDSSQPLVHIEPSLVGRVTEVMVKEGQAVAAGAPLLLLEDEPHRLRLQEAEVALQAAQIEYAAAQAEVRAWPHRLNGQRAMVAAARERCDLARQLLDEKRKTSKYVTVSPVELVMAEGEWRQAQRLLEAEEARLREMQEIDPQWKLGVAESRRRSAELAVHQARRAVQDCVVRTPVAGTVLRINTCRGQTLSPGTMQSPIVLQPDGPVVIRAEIEQEFIGRVREGMRATITDANRPDGLQRSGEVVQVSRWIDRRRPIAIDPGQLPDQRTFECVIRIDGDTSLLLIGQRVRVRLEP